MGKFLESEKVNQTSFKQISSAISEVSRVDGVYKDSFRSFCLPLEHAEENLFPGIRKSAPDFFMEHNIKWHDGQNGKPSNHLCDSQVCCVNFLFPFADKPKELAVLLRPLFPELIMMLPVEDGSYVSFEWIGKDNYLKEKKPANSVRTRGANFTSADVIVMFERVDKKRQIVLIEWKYTESYSPISLAIAKSGTSRVEIYRHLLDAVDCPIDKQRLPKFKDLFFDPFYQLMRQQFLAHEMEKAGEMGADIVTLMHISPEHNLDFKRITSDRLTGLGKSAIEVWSKLVQTDGRFIGVSTEKLFGKLNPLRLPEMIEWTEYIHNRYPWVA